MRASRRGARAKLLATHSSAALACNAFEYWRTAGLGFVEAALGLPAPAVSFKYEGQFPTGLEGTPPNIDVVFRLSDGSIWADRGLAACGELAASLRRGSISFRRLDVAQLLKHALGLTALGSRFTLAYMWLDSDTKTGEEHRREIDTFSKAVESDLSFKPMAYQEFVIRLRLHAGPDHDRFFDYFADRYGCPAR